MNCLPLILASASPRRAELLQQIGVKFQVVPGKTAEVHDEQLTAWEMAQINAYRKARAVAKRHPDVLVLGADTLVYLDRETKFSASRPTLMMPSGCCPNCRDALMQLSPEFVFFICVNIGNEFLPSGLM